MHSAGPKLEPKWKGRTVYIPLIVPDTCLLATGFLVTLVAAILFLVACFTTQWKQERVIMMTNGWTNISYEFEYGIRRMHVSYCQIDTVLDNVHPADLCGGEDVFYSACGITNEFCFGAPSQDIMFYGVCVGLMALLCVLSVLAQFIRRYCHFVWQLPVAILSPFAVLMTSLSIDQVQLSTVVMRVGQQGAFIGNVPDSRNCGIAAVVLTWVALLLMVLDFCVQKYRDSRDAKSQRPRATAGPSRAQGSANQYGGDDEYEANHPHPAAGRGGLDYAAPPRTTHNAGGV